MEPLLVARIVGRAIRGDSASRYRLAEAIGRRLHPQAVLPDIDRVWLDDTAFRKTYARFQPDNRRRMDRVWTLQQYALTVADLEGDTAECGVYTGLGSFIIATSAGKRHHGFDSFQGLSTPTAADGSHWEFGSLAVPEAEAHANLAALPVSLYRGWIPERFHDVADRTFCLVHVDVDLYEPTRDSIDFFWPRLVRNGVMVFDDYGFGTCPGAMKAVDEFVEASPDARFVHLATGQGVAEKL